jgi:mannose-6-phosphate isomerase-like protein (cupin superfamily)
MSDVAFIQMPGQGREIDLGPFQMMVKADAAQTGGAFSLLEASEPPNFGPPLHVHDDAAEAFYVLEGEYLIYIADQVHRCPAGSFIYIPAGLEHGFRVGESESRKLNIYVPGAMVGYFDELKAGAAAGAAPDDAALTAMAARHGMRVLGPVPEGYL